MAGQRGSQGPDAGGWPDRSTLPQDPGQRDHSLARAYPAAPGAAGESPGYSDGYPAAPDPAAGAMLPVRRHRRWPAFVSGLVVGLLFGFLALLIVAVAISQNPVFVAGPGVEDPDLWVSISHGYLNEAVQERLATVPIDLPMGRITALQIGLAESNAGMILTPTFDLGLFTISPSIDNQLGVDDGQITAEMIGEPRVGDFALPIDALPFDLGDVIRDGVNDINRDVLLHELNQSFQAGFGQDPMEVVQINTTSQYLIVKLKRRQE